MEVLCGTGGKNEIIILKGGSRYLSHYGTAGEMKTFQTRRSIMGMGGTII